MLPSGTDASGSVILSFNECFNAPASNRASDPFKIEIMDTAGNIIATDDNSISLSTLVAAELFPSQTSQVNSVIVAEPTAVAFTITNRNPIPPSGGVQLRLPKWNAKAPKDFRESYLIDEITFNASIGNGEEIFSSETVDTGNPEELEIPIDYGRFCSPKKVSKPFLLKKKLLKLLLYLLCLGCVVQYELFALRYEHLRLHHDH